MSMVMSQLTKSDRSALGAGTRNMIDKYYDRKYYSVSREGPREWIGSKQELKKLNKMAEEEFFAAEVTGALNGHACSDTSDSKAEEDGLTVLKDKAEELAVYKRAVERRPNAPMTARRYPAECKRPKSMGL